MAPRATTTYRVTFRALEDLDQAPCSVLRFSSKRVQRASNSM